MKYPAKYVGFPVRPEEAVNMTYSPDSTRIAFTRDNDLYVVDIATGAEKRLTYDGSDVILNGYASWVYYEEIFGRSSNYKAFWWSPDSKRIGFYKFDNSKVPMFPIYSAFANPSGAASQSQSPRVTDLSLGGSLSETRYPKAGQTNPEVKIGIVEVSFSPIGTPIKWADYDPKEDQYFGIPFWGPDSQEFFVARMPRLQNTMDLAVDTASLELPEAPEWAAASVAAMNASGVVLSAEETLTRGQVAEILYQVSRMAADAPGLQMYR